MALAIEVLRADTGGRERHSFASSPVRIGRSPLNNLVLAAPWVSLHHGLIHFDENQASYSDLGSTNGTTVLVKDQERRLHPMVPFQILAAGQSSADALAELRVGAITLRVGRDWQLPAVHGPGGGLGQAVGGKRQFETRLTLGDLKAFQDELRSQAQVRADRHPADRQAPGPGGGRALTRPGGLQRLPSPPAASGVAPVYQAGFTRMMGPDEAAAAMLPATPPPLQPRPSTPGSGPVLDVLGRVSEVWSDGPGGTPRFDGSERAFVETLAAVADAFARGLVELKKGLKEFGEGIGVRAVGGHSPLHRSQNAGEVMSYLLDPAGDTQQRLEQLVDLFADLMIHEVALLNGVKAGVRQLVAEIDPEGGYRRSEAGGKGRGLFDKSLRRYHEFFQSVTEDGGEAIVFGAEFARAYADALGGERAPARRRPTRR